MRARVTRRHRVGEFAKYNLEITKGKEFPSWDREVTFKSQLIDEICSRYRKVVDGEHRSSVDDLLFHSTCSTKGIAKIIQKDGVKRSDSHIRVVLTPHKRKGCALSHAAKRLFFLARPVAATKVDDTVGRALSAFSFQRSACFSVAQTGLSFIFTIP